MARTNSTVSSGRYAGRIAGISLLLMLGVATYFLFTSLSARQDSPSLESAYRSLALNAILVAAALAAGRLSGLLFSEPREEQLGPAILAGSYVLAGVGLWRGLSAFSQQAPVLPGLGLACLTAAAGLAQLPQFD